MITNSGFNILINPAICLPNFCPISSTISMHNKSSLLTASIISSNVSEQFWASMRSERIELSPFLTRSSSMRYKAEPDASVSRHPFFPQWQRISLSKTLMCPNSPENPYLPVYTLPSMMIPMPNPQLTLTKMIFFSPLTHPCKYSPYVIARVSLSMQT